jgi:hypothetical protein
MTLWLPCDVQIWLEGCRQSFAAMTAEKAEREAADAAAAVSRSATQPDDVIDFRHLRARKNMSAIEVEDQARAAVWPLLC